MHTSHPVIQPFLDYLKFEKRYSRHTLLSYETDLGSFFDYLVTQYGGLPLEEITHVYVRSWLAQLKDDGLTAKSLNRKISTLRSFFKHALKTGTVTQTPMSKVSAPKAEKRLPQFVAVKDMDTLFRAVALGDDWKGKTDRLLLLLFYQTGMRLSEAIHLKENSVNVANDTIKVLGKGNKERIVPAGKGLIEAIQQYCAEKKTLPAPRATDVLLITEKGSPLSPRTVYATVRKYLDAVTTVDKRSPHVLRHTFATHLANNGADLNAIKELLGHSSLAATQVYTHNTIEKLRNVYKKAHPKA